MSRIHPAEAKAHDGGADGSVGRASSDAAAPAVYTVWKRSSMGFEGTDGFSVYDGAGRLAFRVDNYARRRKAFAGELLLMDGHGTALVALRPQILSMHDQWNCYKASEEYSHGKRSRSQHLFSMRKCSMLQSNDEAQVYMAGSSTAADSSGQASTPSFWIEGCFRRRSCKIRRSDGEEVAWISRKKAGGASGPVTLGDDVFRLVIRPGVSCAMIMAFVIVMDRIYRRSYKPLMCSS